MRDVGRDKRRSEAGPVLLRFALVNVGEQSVARARKSNRLVGAARRRPIQTSRLPQLVTRERANAIQQRSDLNGASADTCPALGNHVNIVVS